MQHEPAQHGLARPRVHRDGDRCTVAAVTGTEFRLPSWTTMRYKVNFETTVGLAFFGEVYRGAWRGHTVAIKLLAESTLRKIFVNKDKIWKSLYPLNMIELLGASSASGDRWLLVREGPSLS